MQQCLAHAPCAGMCASELQSEGDLGLLLYFSFSRTKFVDDGWMIQKGYLEPEVPAEQSSWWWNQPISALSLPEPITFEDNVHT